MYTNQLRSFSEIFSVEICRVVQHHCMCNLNAGIAAFILFSFLAEQIAIEKDEEQKEYSVSYGTNRVRKNTQNYS